MTGLFAKLKYGISRKITFFLRPNMILDSTKDKTAVICNGTQFVKSCIGRYSYISNSSVVNTEIGSFCSIAGGCVIGGGSHPIEFVSTSPVFYGKRNVLRKNFVNTDYEEFKKTVIGNDVWIGSHCLIKGGVTIGDGAIIGMGSIVTHDIEPYSIVGGNPAKTIRMRFDEETVNALLEIKWWNFDDAKLEKYADIMNDPLRFIEECRND